MLNFESEHPSRKSYENIWKCVIQQIILSYQEKYEINCKQNAKEIIWENYVKFNTHCRNQYMRNPDGLLDRHKVCACYIFAIIKSDVLSVELSEYDKQEKYIIINEHLAITVGMTLLRAFIIESVRRSEYSEEEKVELIDKIENGIHFPQTHHGTYRLNFASELYFSKIEKNFNILSLANTLYLLETYSLYSNSDN